MADNYYNSETVILEFEIAESIDNPPVEQPKGCRGSIDSLLTAVTTLSVAFLLILKKRKKLAKI